MIDRRIRNLRTHHAVQESRPMFTGIIRPFLAGQWDTMTREQRASLSRLVPTPKRE